jgi:hypothetical protein
MRLTRDMLRELGSCGDYIRIFADKFPTSDYPLGVELNRENCAAHHADFDWGWAASTMLTPEGNNRWDTLRLSRRAADRDFGTGSQRNAATFGHLFDTEPELRSQRIAEVARTAEENADRRVLRDLESVQATVSEARQNVTYYTERLTDAEARLPALETAAVEARRRTAERAARRAAEEVATAERRLAQLRDAATSAAAELERFTAASVAAAAEAAAAPEPTADAQADPAVAPDAEPATA